MSIENGHLKKEISSIWDLHSAVYDSAGGMIQNARESEAWASYIKRHLPEGRLKVLDAGCGTGEVGILMAGMGHDVTGIDISEKMLEKAIIKARDEGLSINFMMRDAERTGFETGSFDVIICRFLLWTLPDPHGTLREWHRILKDGGRVLIIDGKWHDNTLEYKLVRMASNLCIRLIDGRKAEKMYSDELKMALKNINGVPPDVAKGYLEASGFKDIAFTDLEEVRRVKLDSVPWRYRAGIGRKYYLIAGTK